jgi:hypothetical protein
MNKIDMIDITWVNDILINIYILYFFVLSLDVLCQNITVFRQFQNLMRMSHSKNSKEFCQNYTHT